MTSKTRGTRAFRTAAEAGCGLAVAVALSAAGAAHAQSNNVIVDMSVLNALGQSRTVPRELQPSGRLLLMPNAGNAGGRLQQLVPPSAAPRRPSRPSASRPARPEPPKMAERPAPREERPAPPRASAEAPQQLTRSSPPPVAPPPPPSIPDAPPASAEAPKAMAETPKAMPKAPAAPEASPTSVSSPPAAAPPPPPPPPAAVPTPEPPSTTATVRAPTGDKAGDKASGEPQTAAAPSSGGGFAPGKQFRINFDAGAATLGSSAERTLDEVSGALQKDDALRLQLLAYAGSNSETESQARRLSLSRALTVRSYLIAKGVRSTRIDVRALGNKSEGGPADRVDVIVTSR